MFRCSNPVAWHGSAEEFSAPSCSWWGTPTFSRRSTPRRRTWSDTPHFGWPGRRGASTSIPLRDGTRTFEDLASFEKGDPVAVYKVREFATADPVADVVWARNDQELLKSTPFTLRGVTIDFKNVAPRLMGLGHARLPQSDPNPQPIPTNEPPFESKGPGFFLLHTPISGTFSAVQSK